MRTIIMKILKDAEETVKSYTDTHAKTLRGKKVNVTDVEMGLLLNLKLVMMEISLMEMGALQTVLSKMRAVKIRIQEMVMIGQIHKLIVLLFAEMD